MSTQGRPGLPCVPLLIHLGTPKCGVLTICSLLRWRRMRQVKIRKLLQLAYAGAFTGSSTHRLFINNLSSEELRLGFSCPGVLASSHSQILQDDQMVSKVSDFSTPPHSPEYAWLPETFQCSCHSTGLVPLPLLRDTWNFPKNG